MCIRLFFTISRLIISSGRPEERRRKEGDFVFPVEWKGNRVTLPTIYARNKICLYYRFCCCSYKDIRKCINSYMLPRLAGFFFIISSGKPEERRRKEGDFVFPVEWKGNRATISRTALLCHIYAWK